MDQIPPGSTVRAEVTTGWATTHPTTRTVQGVAYVDDEGATRIGDVNITRDPDGYFPTGIVVLSVTPQGAECCEPGCTEEVACPAHAPRMRTFEAMYHGTCPACGEHISPGTQVGYEDEALIHGACSSDAPPQKARPVCDRCHLEAGSTVNGLCRDCRA